MRRETITFNHGVLGSSPSALTKQNQTLSSVFCSQNSDDKSGSAHNMHTREDRPPPKWPARLVLAIVIVLGISVAASLFWFRLGRECHDLSLAHSLQLAGC